MTGTRATVQLRRGALDLDVDLELRAEVLALVGPNGSGKSSLLHAITGALRPAKGCIELSGRLVFDSATKIDLPPARRGVGYVPQGYGLFPHLSVLNNVAFGLEATRGGDHLQAAMAQLRALECAHLAERTPRSLSGGERQRVALARALAIDPSVLLLDEPLAALDPSMKRRVRTALRSRLVHTSVPCVVVTHDLRDIRTLADRVVVLEHGRIAQDGTLDALQVAPATDFIGELLSS